MKESSLYYTFSSLLNTTCKEEELQDFLEKHANIIVKTFSQGVQEPLIFPKYELGNDYITDFVLIGYRSNGSLDIDLIEIEPAKKVIPLFNREKQSTGRLRIAEGQIINWQTWINKYAIYFKERLVDDIDKSNKWDDRIIQKILKNLYTLDIVFYRIIIGRRKDFNDWGNQYRNNLWKNSGHRQEIVSWDRLLENSKLL